MLKWSHLHLGNAIIKRTEYNFKKQINFLTLIFKYHLCTCALNILVSTAGNIKKVISKSNRYMFTQLASKTLTM